MKFFLYLLRTKKHIDMSLKNVGLMHKQCGEKRKQQWQDNNPDANIQIGHHCKIAFTEGKEVEHMWVLVLAVDKDKREYAGHLDNDPVVVTNIKYKDTVSFKYADIEDLIKSN